MVEGFTTQCTETWICFIWRVACAVELYSNLGEVRVQSMQGDTVVLEIPSDAQPEDEPVGVPLILTIKFRLEGGTRVVFAGAEVTGRWSLHSVTAFTDGVSFCYCAYVLRISGYSGFLRNLPTNTPIFLCVLRLCGKSRSQQGLSESKKKIGGNRAFCRDNWAYIWKEIAIHSLYFNAFLELWLLNYLWKKRGYPHFSFWLPITHATIYFFPIVVTFAKINLYKEAPSLNWSNITSIHHPRLTQKF